MQQVYVLKHPMIQHKLTVMRQQTTELGLMRNLLTEIATLMAYEVTRDMPAETINIQTPLGRTTGLSIGANRLAIIAVLRAGLGMTGGFSRLMPTAVEGHIGVLCPKSGEGPVEYYVKLPEDISGRDVMLLDPMLAGGNVPVAAIDALKRRACRSIRMVGVIATPMALEAIVAAHPDVPVYVAAVDPAVNAQGLIVPGVGDAIDRLFGVN